MATDIVYVRGSEPAVGALLHAGAKQVSLQLEGGEEASWPAWEVSGISLGDLPREYTAAEEALSDGDFEAALSGFAAVVASGHRAAPVAAFHHANVLRLRATIAGGSSQEASQALTAWLKAYPDHHLRPGALLALWRLSPADALLEQLSEFGPIWALHADLARAFQAALAGDPKPLDEVEQRAEQVPLAGEVVRYAQAWRVEALVRRGQAQAAMDAIPFLEVDGTRRNAAYSAGWTDSPAAPILLNAVGEALIALEPGALGAAAAIPFLQRVIRYYPDLHVEHARALAALAGAFGQVELKEYAVEMAGLLSERYPDAPAKTRGPQGGLGEER